MVSYKAGGQKPASPFAAMALRGNFLVMKETPVVVLNFAMIVLKLGINFLEVLFKPERDHLGEKPKIFYCFSLAGIWPAVGENNASSASDIFH